MPSCSTQLLTDRTVHGFICSVQIYLKKCQWEISNSTTCVGTNSTPWLVAYALLSSQEACWLCCPLWEAVFPLDKIVWFLLYFSCHHFSPRFQVCDPGIHIAWLWFWYWHSVSLLTICYISHSWRPTTYQYLHLVPLMKTWRCFGTAWRSWGWAGKAPSTFVFWNPRTRSSVILSDCTSDSSLEKVCHYCFIRVWIASCTHPLQHGIFSCTGLFPTTIMRSDIALQHINAWKRVDNGKLCMHGFEFGVR